MEQKYEILSVEENLNLYEKMGFREIGLDIDKWGHPTKIYEHDSLV